MSATTVLLLTDRPGFEPIYGPQLGQHGLDASLLLPASLAETAKRGAAIVIDGSPDVYDENELLGAVGFARARGSLVAVGLDDGTSEIDDILEEMCPGLVARGDGDAPRVCQLLARKLDGVRGQRFEFLTVSPGGSELVAILGDGRLFVLPRPVSDDDDGSEVVSIAIATDAQAATVKLSKGREISVSAAEIVLGKAQVEDGAHLGARIRALRLEAGLTQAELARRTGIHRPNIARVEAGRHTPSLETIARLAQAIGVPTTRVLTEE